MERPKSRADVAVFIDFENVYVSVREKFDATPNFEMIMDRCEDYGRIVIARAYADWYRYPRVTSALFANGVEPMYVPTYYYDREVGRTGRPIKNSVDIHLCIDVMRSLYTQHHIDKFVLVTGDRDFIPLVNAIRQNGKEVVIIGIGGASSAHLAQSADEFLFYEQIADLKPQQQQTQRQEPKQEQSAKPERREREKPERSEQREKPERSEQREKPERSDSNGKVDGKRDRDKTERTPAPTPEPASEPEVLAPQRSVYDTLVDAIQLARQRGFVSNLGSLKVLMRELDSGFNESKVKDSNGRPFSKFKDFVKEAERQGKVQIFTNGTVTEVFLPGEDPMRVSQFAEDLASQQAERELESELELEALGAPEIAEPVDLAPEPVDFVEPIVDEPDVAEPVTPEPEPQPVVTPVAEEAMTTTEEETSRPSFGEREWQIFRGSMSQFTDPVRFADIFSALRGLRNQEIIDLTNNELKELVKQAINRGMLQRTGRGAKAYYRLSSQYRVTRDEFYSEPPRLSESQASSAEPVEATQVESAAGLVDDTGVAAAAKRRRARAYSSLVAAAETSATPQAGNETVAAESAAPATDTGAGLELSDRVNDQLATQRVDEPTAKPRRNRRKKPAVPAAEAEQPVEAVADAAPATVENDQAEATAEADGAKATNGTKKRRSRRKKTTEESPTAESETGGE